MAEDKLLKIAKKAALEAGKIVKKYYLSELTPIQSGLILHDKGHYTNFATQADLESEQKIVEILTKNFPNHNIIAEESGQVDKGSEYSWAIDPIDGTIPFVDGIPTFGVSIGVLKNNKPFIGVIYMVATQELYWAQQGKGAFLNGNKIAVRKESHLQNCTVGLDWGHTDRILKLDKFFRPIVEKVRYVYLFGAAVATLVFVARGWVDAYIQRANIWDLAAGAVLIEEAGGKITDFEGNEINWTENRLSMIASNGLIHEAILEVFKK